MNFWQAARIPSLDIWQPVPRLGSSEVFFSYWGWNVSILHLMSGAKVLAQFYSAFQGNLFLCWSLPLQKPNCLSYFWMPISVEGVLHSKWFPESFSFVVEYPYFKMLILMCVFSCCIILLHSLCIPCHVLGFPGIGFVAVTVMSPSAVKYCWSRRLLYPGASPSFWVGRLPSTLNWPPNVDLPLPGVQRLP